MERKELTIYRVGWDSAIENYDDLKMAYTLDWDAEVLLKSEADQVMDALELQHKADAELIAADRRNMEQMKNRIKELEVINKDLIKDRNKTYNIYESRIKEHEDELGQLGTDHFVDANKMMWVSVKDRWPRPDEQVLVLYEGGMMLAHRLTDHPYYITHWMPLPPPPTAEEGKA